MVWLSTRQSGLSPRVRGSLRGVRAARGIRGSIPACAGEPRRGYGFSCPNTVYPRVCGGAVGRSVTLSGIGGLSPRVRGSPAPRSSRSRRCGSIPACAGEPDQAGESAAVDWVYPRVCGGAAQDAVRAIYDLGLSPRVRGSLRLSRVSRPSLGSIPACAGEPITGPLP